MADRPPGRQSRRRVGPIDGSISVFVADERSGGRTDHDTVVVSDRHPIDAARWVRLAEQVLQAEGVRGEAEVSVLFVDEATIARLNEEFMDTAAPTDVLSFPIDGELVEPGRWPDGGTEGPERVAPAPDELPLLLGDVVICPEVAARQAPEHAGTYDDELALLLVHGLLHLLGHDHASDDERVAMQGRERELLARYHGVPARDPWGT